MRRLWAFFGALLAALWGASQAAGPAAASRAVRIAVVVGNNEGHDPARRLRYAERDAAKMYGTLVQLSGFSAEHSKLLLGRSVSEVRRALQDAEARAHTLARAQRASSLLLFYYSGHADGSVLELGQSELGFVELRSFLRSSAARVRVAFIDSCQSGRLVSLKGGQRAPPYQLHVASEMASSGYAVVTSSAADELSQESEEVRGSYFTHFLVSGLRGAADRSGDGRVTLDEAYRFVYARTLARTSTSVAGSQHPMYDFRLAGRGEIVLASAIGHNRVTVQSQRRGRLIVVNQSANAVAAEGDVTPGTPLALSLPPGAYRVYLVQEGAAWSAPVTLESGESAALADAAFKPHTLRRSVVKGGLFEPRWGHTLEAGPLLRASPIADERALLGGALVYHASHPEGWRATARFQSTAAAALGETTGLFDVGLLAGGGYALAFRSAAAFAELLVGYEHLVQAPQHGRRHSAAFSYLAALGFQVPLAGALTLGLSGGLGGRVLALRPAELVHRIDLQGLLTVGWVLVDGQR